MHQLKTLYNYLNSKKGKKILFLTTSNRWKGQNEMPKSSIIAEELSKKLDDVKIIDVSKLNIFPCEGNVSLHEGNMCGIKKALLQNKEKNPHGFIRCWCSINNPSDEMHKVANSIYESDIVIFFGSIRWGKMNSVYTQIVERLTWIQNRFVTFGEENLLKDKMAGVVAVGHNFNGHEAVILEKQVLKFFGFQVPDELSFNWQYSPDEWDESVEGYKKDYPKFLEIFNFKKILKEGLLKFSTWKFFNE